MFHKILNVILIVIVVALAAAIYWRESGRVETHKEVYRDWARASSISLEKIQETEALQATIDSLKLENKRLEVQLKTIEEPGYYLVIDTEAKLFQIRKGQMVVREGQCAVGKGYHEVGSRSWNFETPAGERRITSKNINPTWYRPAWHWQEQGKEVPDEFITFSPNMPESERREAFKIMSHAEQELVKAVPGMLGKYSLGLGDGYYIHYGSGLGSAVSHGCVRLGSEDLEAIYRVLEVGDPVFIY